MTDPRLLARVAALVVLAACSGDSEPLPQPDPLGPLPAPNVVRSTRFASGALCGQCHLAQDDNSALRDAAGRDVSPVFLWRTSMMALATRDPFYLAVFAGELATNPEAADVVNQTCIRCHAPMGALDGAELGDGAALDFDRLVAGADDAAVLGRDGISCSMCHQISAGNLGQESSLSGGFTVGFDREIYGPHVGPDTEPMNMFINYTPVESAHISQSEVCATCHTVIVTPLDEAGNPLDTEVVEQATYLEWTNSTWSNSIGGDAVACGGCHLPTVDEDDNEIIAPIAAFPEGLIARRPYGRHNLVGGGAYLQRLIAANIEWSGLTVDAAELEQAAQRSEAHLRTAAVVEVSGASSSNGELSFAVTVQNETGHKLPTGYPTRRVWLHTTVRNSSGTIVFESGAPDASGAISGDGERRAHVDRITASDQVAVWEANLVGSDGRATHRAFDARGVGKDNRILPIGFSMSHPDINRMRPEGVTGDPDFVAGSDTVHYELDGLPGSGFQIEVELLYQSVAPHVVDSIRETPTPAGVRFANMVEAMPPPAIRLAATGPAREP